MITAYTFILQWSDNGWYDDDDDEDDEDDDDAIPSIVNKMGLAS